MTYSFAFEVGVHIEIVVEENCKELSKVRPLKAIFLTWNNQCRMKQTISVLSQLELFPTF